jgi:hypothetical protein
MYSNTIRFSFAVLYAAAAAAAAAGGAPADGVEARYQAERTACAQREQADDRATCLREAAAARSDALRGELTDAQSDYERNALARCDALPQSERDLCVRRTRGEGVVQGSVSEGGIYREYREITLPPEQPGSADGPQPGSADSSADSRQ